MLKDKTLTFPQEVIAESARGNLIAMMIVATQYFTGSDQDPAAFWRYVGRRFAPAWLNIDYGDISEVATQIARNMASCGMEIEAFGCDNERAELVMTNWPPEEFAAFYGISEEDAAVVWEVFRPIVAALGLLYDCTVTDGTILITIDA